MDTWEIGIALFGGIAIAQSFFLGGYLLIKDQFRSNPTLFLSLILIGIATRVSKSLFYYLIPEVAQWGVAFGGAGLLAIGPSFWLYTKSTKQTKIKWWDYLHYFPSMFLLLFGWKVGMEVVVLGYHWGTHLLLIYLLISWYLFYSGNWNGNKNRFLLFFGSVSLVWSIFALQMMTGSIQWYTIGTAFICLVLYGINFKIMLDQSILKPPKLNGKKVEESLQNEILAELEKLFGEGKIYRRKGLTLSKVSEEMAKPTYLISKVINQHYGLKFNDFVNRHRVEEAKDRLKDLERNHKIEVIATDVGFSSTSSLYQAFKRETNLTPQAFRKNHKKLPA